VSRHELTAFERAELEALDRILAHEPVGEEHLELAALVDSVRAGAPRMDPAFRGRLDERIAARARRRSPIRVRRMALAGGSLVAAAVGFAIVISSGVLNGGSGNPAQRSVGAGPARASSPAPHAFAQANGGAPSAAPRALPSPPAAGAAGRLAHQSSSLTLATPVASISRVAARIVAATERRGGYVASSEVYVQGPASNASFTLEVPSGRLGSLIAAVSALGSVRSLEQATNDITNAYDDALAVLATRQAERTALLHALAHAATASQATHFQDEIDRIDRRIAAQQRAIAALRSQARLATLQVQVIAAAAPGPAHHAGGGGGPIERAFRDALGALSEILAVVLVALAIALPVALTALAFWWSAGALRQRARERALRSA